MARVDERNNRGGLIGQVERVEVPTPGDLKPLTRWDAWDLKGREAGRFNTRTDANIALCIDQQLDAAGWDTRKPGRSGKPAPSSDRA